VSNKNKHNSIVFLTTLSVYLGLVLVGAPPILAQAALTREQYEIKFAKENKDELEKPLNDKNLFIPQIIQLINELNSLSKQQSFDWNAKNHYEIEGLVFCESDNSPSYLGTGSFGNEPFNASDDFAVRLGREISKRRVADGFGDFYSQGVSFDFSTENSVFSLKTTVENKNSQETQTFFNEIMAYFKKFASIPISSKEKIIYENTKVTSENNQVFIVTRLPRGSLDELLKKREGGK